MVGMFLLLAVGKALLSIQQSEIPVKRSCTSGELKLHSFWQLFPQWCCWQLNSNYRLESNFNIEGSDPCFCVKTGSWRRLNCSKTQTRQYPPPIPPKNKQWHKINGFISNWSIHCEYDSYAWDKWIRRSRNKWWVEIAFFLTALSTMMLLTIEF